MKYSWIRIFISLLLILVLLINISPIKAQATGGAALLGVIKGATLVSVPVAVWAAAALIAIGVTVDWVTDPNYNSYDALVDDVSTFLTNAGTYVKDGMIDMYRVVDETGKAVFYAAGDAMEAVRSRLFDSGVVLSPPSPVSAGTSFSLGGRTYKATASVVPLIVKAKIGYNIYYAHFFIGGTDSSLKVSCNGVDTFTYATDVTGTDIYYASILYGQPSEEDINQAFDFSKTNYSNVTAFGSALIAYLGAGSDAFLAPDNAYGLALGCFPTVPIDGTGAREWSEEYTNNGLYIVGTGGSGNNNPNDGKWFWPLAFGLTAAELYAMSQAEQWAGETPSEFSDYEVQEDYSVSPGQEVEFGQSVELTPDPSANPDAGTGTNPDPGTSSNGAQSVIDHFTPSGTITDYSLDLSSLFPFCIPFDLYDFLSVLKADPVAPVFEFDLNLGVTSAPICIDLSGWSDLASVVRGLEVALFCIGLALKTKELIGT